MTKEMKERIASEAWLRQMADAEDRCGAVSVGGLAVDLGVLRSASADKPRVLSRFIELARRARGMTVEILAERADVDLGELVAIERDEDVSPTPRTVYQLARLLGVPTGKLMVLAGLAEEEDSTLDRAALKFAARSEPAARLSKAEREALDEFVKVLVEQSDQG